VAGSSSYIDIKREIVDRIRRGDWPLDTIIPGEIDLAVELGCARATVNRALRELADEGIVERRRKAGTRVVAGQSRSARIDIPVIRTQIEALGAAYRYQLLDRSVVAAPKAISDRLNIGVGEEVLSLRCLHFAGPAPHQLELRWINLAAVPAARKESFEGIGPNEWLLREKPLTDAEHVMSAANARREEAALLGIAERDAVFVLERRTWLGAETITWVRLLHVGAGFEMRSRSLQPVHAGHDRAAG